MKITLFIVVLISNFSFSQLNESKKTIDQRLIKTNLNSKSVDGFREETVLAQKTLDTIKIYYDKDDKAKIIKVIDKINGFDKKNSDLMISHLNLNSKPTFSEKAETIDYLYDSKNKILTLKIFETKEKKKLIEIQMISDYETIKKNLPQTIKF